MKYTIYFFTFLLFLSIPVYAHAQIRINEIAWMGTPDSQYGEWIELYNDGSDPVNLAGWKLYVDGGSTVLFTLTKSISAGGYLLVERTTASTPDPVPGINDESGSFGGGGLANTGEDLVLKDAQGTAVQTLAFLSAWPAGDATTKQTMQWNGSTWVTAAPTPKAATITSGTSQTQTSEEIQTTTTTTPSTVTTSSKKNRPKPSFKPLLPYVVFDIPAYVYRGMPQEFSAHIALVDAFEGDQYWATGKYVFNMGNGDTVTATGSTPISYTYPYPGTYTISVQYYRIPSDPKPLIVDHQSVEVIDPHISIERVSNGAVKLANMTNSEVPIGGWHIDDGTVPAETILAPHASIILSAASLGISVFHTASLRAPNTEIVAAVLAADTTPPHDSVIGRVTKQAAVIGDIVTAPTAEAATVSEGVTPASQPKTTNRTMIVIIGAVVLFVISLYLLLERFMAQQE